VSIQEKFLGWGPREAFVSLPDSQVLLREDDMAALAAFGDSAIEAGLGGSVLCAKEDGL
jgi:hypothetical protein